MSWDPAKQLFNFYELLEDGGPQRASWFYRGDSRLILEDIQLLYRQRSAGQSPFRAQLRCSGCHVNGGLLQKELSPPYNDWWMKSRPLPLGSLTPDSTVAKILPGLVDADELAKLVHAASRRLAASPAYRKILRSRTMQEQLRPLFCAVELNIESDRDPFDERQPAVQIPAGFFADPRLGTSSIAIPRQHYEHALQQLRSHMRHLPDRADGGPDFLPRFQAALKTSAEPAAKLLLGHLTDPKRDANFHRQQVRGYLDACQERASEPEAAMEWLAVLAQRRAEVDQAELSMHPDGRILESPGRVVFPLASAPGGRLGFTAACEVRPR